MSRAPKPPPALDDESEPDWALFGWGIGNCDPARLNPAPYRSARPSPESELAAGENDDGPAKPMAARDERDDS